MIEDTLKKLGLAIIEESRLTDEIWKNHHIDDDADEIDEMQTYLNMYFGWGNAHHNKHSTFQEYCMKEKIPICEKCELVYRLILERKAVKRKIRAFHGAVTKYALSIANENAKQKECV